MKIHPIVLALFASVLIFAASPMQGLCADYVPTGCSQSVSLPESGEKIWVNGANYFTYEFDKRPAMGPLVLKLKLFDKDGSRVTTLNFKGSSDMPSMRGAHYTGDKPFKVSKRGDYLLPVDVVMPGDWEIQVMALEGDKIIFCGNIKFDI